MSRSWVVLLALLAACSHELQKMPPRWAAASAECKDLSGTYDGAILASLIETDVDSRDDSRGPERYSAVRVEVDASGVASFTGERDEQRTRLASPRQWSCAHGVLTGLAQASTVRLWQGADGALIAEETLERLERHLRRSHPVRRVLSRSYFRFAPAASASG